MAPPSQVQHLNWHSMCSMSVFVPCFFLQSLVYLRCTTKSLLLKTVFSFRVDTLSILKVEIRTWSYSLCFFLYNFSSCSSIENLRFRSLLCWWRAQPHLLHILDKYFLYQATLGSDAPSFCFWSCATIQCCHLFISLHDS